MLTAAVVFSVLFFPFKGEPWSLPAAILASYSAFVLGLAFGDAKDYLERVEIQREARRLLPIHAFVLLIAFAAITVWVRLQPLLPEGLTHQYRKGSFWDLALELPLIIAGVCQGFWMRGIMKRALKDSDD